MEEKEHGDFFMLRCFSFHPLPLLRLHLERRIIDVQCFSPLLQISAKVGGCETIFDQAEEETQPFRISFIRTCFKKVRERKLILVYGSQEKQFGPPPLPPLGRRPRKTFF